MKSLNKNKLAMFDLDGTLFDTKNINYNAYLYALTNVGLDVKIFNYDYYCKFCNGNNYKVFIPILYNDITETQLQQIHSIKQFVYKNYIQYGRINSSLFSLIYSIKNSYIISLVTMASRVNAMEILEYFNVVDIFDYIVTQEDIKIKKPAPDCFLDMLSVVGLDKKDAIIFEDSKIGLTAAKESGISYVQIHGYN